MMFNREFMLQNEHIYVFNEQGDNIKLVVEDYEFEDKSLQTVDLADPKFVRQNTACKLVNVFVNIGDSVQKGDKLAVVEIMKLHVNILLFIYKHTLTSQGAFKVKKINFKLNERI